MPCGSGFTYVIVVNADSGCETVSTSADDKIRWASRLGADITLDFELAI